MTDLLILAVIILKILQVNPIKKYFTEGSFKTAEGSFWETVPEEGEEVHC